MEIKIALAGNPNSGKTTLFNKLTGSNQYVGNWPGVTVEKKQGRMLADKDFIITDLPGIYSLSPYSPEELVARKYIIEENPDIILNIIDGTNIERNLYLTLQLIETGVPVVAAINMIDIVRKNGDYLSIEKLAENLGVPVVGISALRGMGIDNLVSVLKKILRSTRNVPVHRFSPDVEGVIKLIENELKNISEKEKRFVAVKIFEGDNKELQKVRDRVGLNKINYYIKECENTYDNDGESIIISQRYDYLEKIISKCYKKSGKTGISQKIDLILTGKYTAIPVFILIMLTLFYTSVSLLGSTFSDIINDNIFANLIIPNVKIFLSFINCSEWLSALVTEGIISGVGSVIAFVPQLAILFFLLSFLEDLGYMARVAFLMDRLFRKFGLSGKSIIPLLIGTGCSVPGIMASRTIENETNRKLTILTTPFVPCSAKLPLIALISTIFFGGKWWTSPLMYLIGVAAVLFSSLFIKGIWCEKTGEIPFIMEIPNYHMPKLSVVLSHMWNRVKGFLIKAGTVLVLVCTVMWILSHTGFYQNRLCLVGNEKSFLSEISSFIAPVFAPIGFGNWQSTASVFAGFFAKENIVATLNLLTSGNDYMGMILPNSICALSFLLFNLLNSPCIMAVTTMCRELKSIKWFVFSVLYQNILAYSLCLVVYQLWGLFAGIVNFNLFTVFALVVLIFFLYGIKRGLSQNSPHNFIP